MNIETLLNEIVSDDGDPEASASLKKWITESIYDDYTFSQLDDAIRSILSEDPSRRQKLIFALGPIFLNLLSSDEVSSRDEYLGGICRTLNLMFHQTPIETKSAFLSSNLRLFKSLSRSLPLIGDFEAQVTNVEFLARIGLCNSATKNTYRKILDWDEELCEQFLSISRDQFEPDVRKFLNRMNELSGSRARVRTLPATSVSISGISVFKPSGAEYENFWIDFNLGSSSILIFCQPINSNFWNAITIRDSDVSNVEIVTEENSQTLVVTLNKEAYLLFDEASSQDFPGTNITISFAKAIPLWMNVTKVFPNLSVLVRTDNASTPEKVNSSDDLVFLASSVIDLCDGDADHSEVESSTKNQTGRDSHTTKMDEDIEQPKETPARIRGRKRRAAQNRKPAEDKRKKKDQVDNDERRSVRFNENVVSRPTRRTVAKPKKTPRVKNSRVKRNLDKDNSTLRDVSLDADERGVNVDVEPPLPEPEVSSSSKKLVGSLSADWTCNQDTSPSSPSPKAPELEKSADYKQISLDAKKVEESKEVEVGKVETKRPLRRSIKPKQYAETSSPDYDLDDGQHNRRPSRQCKNKKLSKTDISVISDKLSVQPNLQKSNLDEITKKAINETDSVLKREEKKLAHKTASSTKEEPPKPSSSSKSPYDALLEDDDLDSAWNAFKRRQLEIKQRRQAQDLENSFGGKPTAPKFSSTPLNTKQKKPETEKSTDDPSRRRKSEIERKKESPLLCSVRSDLVPCPSATEKPSPQKATDETTETNSQIHVNNLGVVSPVAVEPLCPEPATDASSAVEEINTPELGNAKKLSFSKVSSTESIVDEVHETGDDHQAPANDNLLYDTPKTRAYSTPTQRQFRKRGRVTKSGDESSVMANTLQRPRPTMKITAMGYQPLRVEVRDVVDLLRSDLLADHHAQSKQLSDLLQKTFQEILATYFEISERLNRKYNELDRKLEDFMRKVDDVVQNEN